VPAVEQHLRHLQAVQLVREAGPEAYAFRHALQREAVYATLLRGERRATHQAVAAALAEVHASALDEHLPELAYHHYEAGDWPAALDFARRAGEQAQRRFAPHEAHEHFSRALRAAERLGERPAPGLYRARGQAREVIGDFDGALADHLAALAAAQAAGQGAPEWQALIDLGTLWAGRSYEQTGHYFRLALARAHGLDAAALARSLNWMGNWHLNRDEVVEALDYHRQALRLFEARDDARGLAETHDLLGLTLLNAGDGVHSRAHYRQALARFAALDDRRGQASALAIMAEHAPGFASDTMAVINTLAQGRAEAGQALELACAIGWRAGEAYARLVIAGLLTAHGDFGAGWDAMQAGQALAAEIGHHQWLTLARTVRSNWYFELGALDEARAHITAACDLAGQVNSQLWARFGHALLALVCVAQGDPAGAENALRDEPGPDAIPRSGAARLVACAHIELALARQDHAQALSILDRALEHLPNLGQGRVPPRLWRMRAEVLAAIGALDEAEHTWRELLRAVPDMRCLQWRAHAALAGVCDRLGRPADAERERATAAELIARLATDVPDAALREGFVRRAREAL
jgi:tetratricopeptide (TPR) repeat protein